MSSTSANGQESKADFKFNTLNKWIKDVIELNIVNDKITMILIIIMTQCCLTLSRPRMISVIGSLTISGRLFKK